MVFLVFLSTLYILSTLCLVLLCILLFLTNICVVMSVTSTFIINSLLSLVLVLKISLVTSSIFPFSSLMCSLCIKTVENRGDVLIYLLLWNIFVPFLAATSFGKTFISLIIVVFYIFWR